MSIIQQYLDEASDPVRKSVVYGQLSLFLRKEGFGKFKRLGRKYKLCISGTRLQIVISCTFKPNKYVKENDTHK